MMDTKKMRTCAPLLPEPGDKVVCECLDEIERLREALQNAHAGFDLAYDALEKGCYDEAMLHCGHHHAQSGKALLTPNEQGHGRADSEAGRPSPAPDC